MTQTRKWQYACPRCKADIVVDPGYPAWCENCGWNTEPEPWPPPSSAIAKLYLSLGKRFGNSLLDEIVHTSELRPTPTTSDISALIIATVTHAITLAFWGAGLWLIFGVAIRYWDEGRQVLALSVPAGILCLLIGYWLTPKLGKMPKEAFTHNQLPKTFELVDRVTTALHASNVQGIIIDERWNASFTQVGIRREGILRIGLPLVTTLDSQELIALIGHEVAHGINGDPTRGLYVGSAIQSLNHWYTTLDMLAIGMVRTRSIYSATLGFLLKLLTVIPWALIQVLLNLTWRGSQRAEYLADYLGAKVGGSSAMISLLRKLHLGHVFAQTVDRVAQRWAIEQLSIFKEMKSYVSQMPARELERLRRLEIHEDAQLDRTHPPTAFRVRSIEAHEARSDNSAMVVLADLEKDAALYELSAYEPTVERFLLQDYR